MIKMIEYIELNKGKYESEANEIIVILKNSYYFK